MRLVAVDVEAVEREFEEAAVLGAAVLAEADAVSVSGLTSVLVLGVSAGTDLKARSTRAAAAFGRKFPWAAFLARDATPVSERFR